MQPSTVSGFHVFFRYIKFVSKSLVFHQPASGEGGGGHSGLMFDRNAGMLASITCGHRWHASITGMPECGHH